MTAIPFVRLDEPRYGEPVPVAPALRRVVARNPSKFTYLGTGTYVIGGDRPGDPVAVVDPGPRLDAHRDALAAAIAGQQVVAILVTHCHADHVPLTAWLREATGAPTMAFGPHPRRDDPDADVPYTDLDDDEDEPEEAAEERDPTAPAPEAVDETTDHDFVPDVHLAHGDVAVELPGLTVRAVHTPGHTSNHLCFSLDEHRALLTGDHVMGWSTTVIAPPDGDMRAYFDSLERVRGRADEVLWPTHGAPVTDPAPFLEAFVEHRLRREADLLALVRGGEARVAPMVRTLYAAVPRKLHRPAARSVLAHLVKLVDDGLIAVDDGGRPRLSASFRPI